MNILVLGGSGLIGRAFTQEMCAAGHYVTILSRRPDKVQAGEAQVRAWDGVSELGWTDLVETADAVVNLAGENIGAAVWTPNRKQRILQSRLSAGRAVEAAVRSARRKPAVVMQSSAVGYYGPAAGTRELKEDEPAGVDFLASVAEQWENASQGVEAYGVRRIVIRIGVVLDRTEGILPRFLLPFRLFAGGPIGSGRQVISWIHLADQVAAMRFLLENEESNGAYNLCSPFAVSNAEFGKELARLLKRPYWLPVPGFALRLILGEMSTLVLDGQRVVPARLTAEGFTFRFSRLRTALEDLLNR